ncbi:MAG: DNA internalization-related competence protein ComEC/Rec2 [Candidatus Marinimicrobia bacterium]|nr:DNA internalization-related competence protein ComEC/Rec2 [Candidatus Neomarinimicrobiota bacterium]
MITIVCIVLAPMSRKPEILLLLLVLSGCFRVAFEKMLPVTHLSLFKAKADSIFVVKAIVLEVGETQKGTPKFMIQPETIDNKDISGGSILLYSKDIQQTVSPGDTLFGRLQLNKPRDKRNPHEFDYARYLAGKDVYYEAFLEDAGEVSVYPRGDTSVRLFMQDVQGMISRHFHEYLTPRSAGILSALILGEKSEIEETTRNDFANTGVIHVLAVSGLHVGYVSLILITIFGLARLPHQIQMGCVIMGLFFYVGLTGSAPSVMRASIMASLMIVGGLLERKPDIINILASAAFIILIISPEQLNNIGFQLSFLAVLSIVTLFPVFKGMVSGLQISRSGFGKLISPLLDLFLVSLAAQLGTLAITIFYFQKIPIISLGANLVVVPLIGVIVATGMSFLILGSFFPILAQLWAATLEGAIDIMLWFVQFCAGADWAYITVRSIQPYELILLLTAIFSITVIKGGKLIKFWLILVLLWLCAQSWQSLLKDPHLEMVVLDVGQGDAILIHAPNGNTILIDTGLRFGGKDMGEDVILPYMQYRNWSKLDLLVMTHPHNDHIGGAQFLIENIEVKKVLMPEIEYESYGYEKLCDIIDTKKIPSSSVFAGYTDSTLKPIYFRVTGPRRYDHESRPSNINNTSIVIQLFYGESSVLLPGDGEERIEHDQLHLGGLLKSDLIKAPHHGSKTSSTQEYINLVKPQVCLISLGLKNKFRHPSKVTLDKYEQLGSEIHRTDLEGAQIYRSDGKKWYRDEWKDKY